MLNIDVEHLVIHNIKKLITKIFRHMIFIIHVQICR